MPRKSRKGIASTLAARKKWQAYGDRATQYCRDVIDGNIPACRSLRQACERHFKDLLRIRDKEFEYKFDGPRGGKVCGFIERFPHVKGKWARGNQPIRLEPWQCFVVVSIFGWVHKKSNLRRFTEARIFVPRKNAKSIMAGGIGLYMLVADGEPGAEVYSGATNKSQSREVFGPAAKMARRADGFKEWYGITIAKESMYLIDEGSKFEIVIGSPGDGPSPHCFIHDEFHEQATWEQYETGRTGMMAREQPLQLVVSTAGFSIESPCHELWVDLQQVLEGLIENDRLFGFIGTVDDPDRLVTNEKGDQVPYWTTPAAVREANPNYGVSVLEDRIQSDHKQAVQRANRQNAFKVKNLNIWVNAREAWMDMVAWRACAEPSLKVQEFIHDPCIEGYDLGARVDLTSCCKVFTRWIAGERHYYAFWRHYVPIDCANDGQHPHYERWLENKQVIGHPGPEILLGKVQKDIEGDIEIFNYSRMGFDQHQAMQMQQDLKLRVGTDNQGEDKVCDVPQTWKYLDPAMKEVEAAVLSRRFHHTGDVPATWAIGNVIVKPDANENIFPRKEANRISKIDPASALFNAMYLALAAVPPEQHIPLVIRSV